VGKSFKKMLPVIGAVAGSFIPGVGTAVGSALGGALGGALSGGAESANVQAPNRALWDISKEVKPAQQDYASVLQNSKNVAGAASPYQTDVMKAMGMAASGQGPSLAEAQMKSAQDRTLAQQLAATKAGRGGSTALGQRQLMQQMGSSGRDIAQGAAEARLQERQNFMNQAGLAQQGLRQDITGNLNLALMPKQSLQQQELARVQAANQQAAANASSGNNMLGAMMGTAGQLIAGFAGGGGGGGSSTPSSGGYSVGGTNYGGSSGQSITGANYDLSSLPVFKKNGGLIEAGKSKPTLKYKKGGLVSKYQEYDTEDDTSIDDEDDDDENDNNNDESDNGYKNGGLAKALKDAKDTKEVDEIIPDKGWGKITIMKNQGGPVNATKGGKLNGPGTGTSDSIPARLSDGEFVVKASVVKRPGVLEHLQKLNAGKKISSRDVSQLVKALMAKKKGK
jgi:hypothetical protein